MSHVPASDVDVGRCGVKAHTDITDGMDVGRLAMDVGGQGGRLGREETSHLVAELGR